MSKVFSAKLNSVEFDYEFLDGTQAKFGFRQSSTEEIDNSADLESGAGDTRALLANAKTQIKARLTGDETLIEKLINEQMKSGNLYEFSGELNALLASERAKKKRS
jgi:hypothetical protein